jgi:hypothetical protein
VQTKQGNTYIAKVYKAHPGDERDRLTTEYAAFSFLHEHGILRVPRPVASDRENFIGIYEYIEGKKLTPKNLKPKNISAACAFLESLHIVSKKSVAAKLPAASEACFSLAEYQSNITRRLARLVISPALPAGLAASLQTTWTQVLAASQEVARAKGISWTAVLPKNKRTLSPSDFGFHNALSSSGGTLVFMDFEYFGWDDPAKMTADFLLHPRGSVPPQYQKHVVSSVARYVDDPGFLDRLSIVYLLLSFKWCLIMLNSFVRQSSASTHQAVQHKKVDRQLRYVQSLLHTPPTFTG